MAEQCCFLHWLAMGAPMVTVLLLASLTAFSWLAWRKLSLLRGLMPENRLAAPLERLRSVVFDGLLQRRMVRMEPAAGWMHAAIFLGFLALLVRKVQLLVIGYDEHFALPGVWGGGFAAAKDGVELLLIGALAYAFYRRYVLKPARLEPNREALGVLLLISVIVLSDLLFDGFRFALHSAQQPGLAHEREYAFAGDALASVLATLPRGVQQAGYHASYWLQLLTVFAFLVWLPMGEHFHIVTALPALFLRRGTPAHTVPAVDLAPLQADDADPDSLRIGARTVRDLTWKEGLDLFTCTECGRCKDACPTFLSGKPLSMKAVNDQLKHHLLERAAEPPALVGPVISEEVLWSCTTCGACEAACPIHLEHLPRFFRLRQHQVMMQGEFPHELQAVFAAYESQSNPWGLPAQQRGDWARGLNLPLWRSAEQASEFDALLYAGSACSYDPRGQKIVRAFVQVLQAAGVRVAVLGECETSTGECVRRAGNELLFQQLASTLVATLNERGVRHILTCDPHAYNALRNELPAFGLTATVEHHSQAMARLLREGRLLLEPREQRITFHDPCYLGRHNGEYAAPRELLRALAGSAPVEMALHGEKAMCCGAGGGRMWMEENSGRRINELRCEQALATAPEVVATACPYCAVMVGDGLKALPDDEGKGSAVASFDLAELVAQRLRQEVSTA